MTMSDLPRRQGWTLTEVLCVIAIIGTLVGLALPALARLREAANRVVCQNNLKQLMIAVHLYHEQHRTLPPYATSGQVQGSWFVHLLPYLDRADIYNKIRIPDDDLATGMETTVLADGIRDVAFAILMCPSDPTLYADPDDGRTSYLANWYAFADGAGKAYSRPNALTQLTDGISNVVFFAEAYSYCNGLPRLALVSSYYHNFGITQDGKPSDDPSYLPDDYTMFQVQPSLDSGPTCCHKWRTQTPHLTMTIAVGDGSVHAVSASISPLTWKESLKPQDGKGTFWE